MYHSVGDVGTTQTLAFVQSVLCSTLTDDPRMSTDISLQGAHKPDNIQVCRACQLVTHRMIVS